MGRMWFKLNQDTKICVNTAVGMTDTVSADECVGQDSARRAWEAGKLVVQAGLT